MGAVNDGHVLIKLFLISCFFLMCLSGIDLLEDFFCVWRSINNGWTVLA